MFKGNLLLTALVILTLFTSPVFSIQPDPAQGIYEIEKISADNIHRHFCQTYSGEKGIVLNDPWKGEVWRHTSCSQMVNIMKLRLQMLLTAEVSSLIDTDFIKEIAHISRTPDEGNNGFRAGNVFYDLKPSDKESFLEFHHMAKEIYKTSSSEILINRGSADNKRMKVRQVDVNNNIASEYDVQGINTNSIPDFVENLISSINLMAIDFSETDEVDELEKMIIYQSRLFLLVQPFQDGNTRTALILMNFMRLYFGLYPYEAYSLPDLRDNSSSLIHNSFQSNKCDRYYCNIIELGRYLTAPFFP